MTADAAGGVWTYSLDLCACLARNGVEIVLATLGAPLTPMQRAAVAGLSGAQLEESTFKLEWMTEPWADLEAAGHWLLHLEREHLLTSCISTI